MHCCTIDPNIPVLINIFVSCGMVNFAYFRKSPVGMISDTMWKQCDHSWQKKFWLNSTCSIIIKLHTITMFMNSGYMWCNCSKVLQIMATAILLIYSWNWPALHLSVHVHTLPRLSSLLLYKSTTFGHNCFQPVSKYCFILLLYAMLKTTSCATGDLFLGPVLILGILPNLRL